MRALAFAERGCFFFVEGRLSDDFPGSNAEKGTDREGRKDPPGGVETLDLPDRMRLWRQPRIGNI